MRKKIFLFSVVVLTLLSFSTLIGTRVINENLRLNQTPSMVVTDSILTKDINRNVRAISVNDLKNQMGGGVSSVFGRVGDITALQGDYDTFFYTKTESDNKYLQLTGGTVTGNINVNGTANFGDGTDNRQIVEIVALNNGTNPTAISSTAADLILKNNSTVNGNHSAISGYNSNNLITSRISLVNTNVTNRHGDIRFYTHDGSALRLALNINKDGNAIFENDVSAVNFIGSGLQLTGVLNSVQAGTNITIDNTDPKNPIINSTGGGATNLSYISGVTNGTVTSDTGTNAVIPTVTSSNAGLQKPDFYEEGTFTPNVTGSYTYTLVTASKKRVGNTVTVTIEMSGINGSGIFSIDNLPYTSVHTGGGILTTLSGTNLSDFQINKAGLTIDSGTTLVGISILNGGGLGSISITSGTFRATLIYETNVYTP